MNIGVQISFWDSDFTSFGCRPRSEIARFCDSSSFNFLGNLHILFYVVLPIYIPTNSVKGFLSHILISICHLCLFANSHPNRCEVTSHVVLIWIFLMISDEWCWALFHVSVSHLCAFFGTMTIQFLCPYFNHIVCRFSYICMLTWIVHEQ